MGRLIFLSPLLLFVLLAADRAEDSRDADVRGIEEARQALRREAFPWYDKANDSLKPVHVDADRAERSQENDGRSYSFNLGPLPTIVSFALLVLIFGVIAWLIVRAYLLGETTLLVANTGVRQTAVDDAARIEALPFRIRSQDVDLLGEARRLYEEGKYSEAIVYLFSYQLIDMDRHQIIHLSKGKTNRQYLRELRRQPPLRSIVEQSMTAFEEVFFGGRQLGREAFEAIWRQLDRFTAMLAQPEGV